MDGTSSPDKSAGHAGQCGQAAPGARRLGWRCGAGAEFRWRDESVGQAAARPLVGCVRIGEHGAQGRFKVLLDRIREPVPGLAGELGGLPGQGGDHTAAALCGEIFEPPSNCCRSCSGYEPHRPTGRYGSMNS